MNTLYFFLIGKKKTKKQMQLVGSCLLTLNLDV